jgi:hypothetical protein
MVEQSVKRQQYFVLRTVLHVTHIESDSQLIWHCEEVRRLEFGYDRRPACTRVCACGGKVDALYFSSRGALLPFTARRSCNGFCV